MCSTAQPKKKKDSPSSSHLMKSKKDWMALALAAIRCNCEPPRQCRQQLVKDNRQDSADTWPVLQGIQRFFIEKCKQGLGGYTSARSWRLACNSLYLILW